MKDETTAGSWISMAGEGTSNERLRRSVLSAWTEKNGFVLEEADKMIISIKKGRLSLFGSADKMVKGMRAEKYGENTVAKYRSTLPDFFKYLGLGYDGFDEQFDRSVTKVQIVETEHATLSPAHAKRLLELLSPQIGALFVVCVSTGHRISSVRLLQRSRLNLKLDPVTVKFAPRNDKQKFSRTSFLSPYTADVYHHYVQTLEGHFSKKAQTPWCFPAPTFESRGAEYDPSQPVSYKHALDTFRDAFNLLGLTQRDEITGRYLMKPHGFRNLHLNIAKGSKYPADWAEHNIGHVNRVRDSYPGDDVAADVWRQTVGPAIDKYLHGDEKWMPKWTVS